MLKYNVIVAMYGKNILNFLKKDLHSNFFCIIFALANKENRSVDHFTIHRGVEQLAARRAHNPEAGGSSPPPATTTGETAMFLLFSFAGVGLERLKFSVSV